MEPKTLGWALALPVGNRWRGLGMVEGRPTFQGIALDDAGGPAAYWLFPRHPGTWWPGLPSILASEPIPAGDVLHLYRKRRSGQPLQEAVGAFPDGAIGPPGGKRGAPPADDHASAVNFPIIPRELARCFLPYSMRKLTNSHEELSEK